MGESRSKTPTRTQLREEIKSLGITAKIAGMPIKKLIAAALISDDPYGYLATFAPPAAADRTAQAKPAPRPGPRLVDVTITLPVDVHGCPGYVPEHVEVGNMRADPHQGRALAYLREGMKHHNVRLNNDRPIFYNADVIRRILEQVDAQLPVEEK